MLHVFISNVMASYAGQISNAAVKKGFAAYHCLNFYDDLVNHYD